MRVQLWTGYLQLGDPGPQADGAAAALGAGGGGEPEAEQPGAAPGLLQAGSEHLGTGVPTAEKVFILPVRRPILLPAVPVCAGRAADAVLPSEHPRVGGL